MKKILLLLVLLGVVVGYVYANKNNLLSQNDSEVSAEIDTLQGNIGQQLSIFSSRAQEIGSQAKNVLGSSVQVDDSEQSLQEKAIDYGQYLYCKQVVDSYESEQ